MIVTARRVLAALLVVPVLSTAAEKLDPRPTETWEPEPAVVTPGAGASPPSDAIVLFDGESLAGWVHEDGRAAEWRVGDGAFTVVPGSGSIRTRQSFGDVQLHIEWRAPAVVEGEGQGRGNSGVFFQGLYEVQILDSFENRTYSNGQAASVYKQHSPLVNASRPPGEWQVYDIVFEAPVFGDNGSLRKPAYVTVFHNGVLVQNHVQLTGPMTFRGLPQYRAHEAKRPLMLQDHKNPVSFRNIWIREL